MKPRQPLLKEGANLSKINLNNKWIGYRHDRSPHYCGLFFHDATLERYGSFEVLIENKVDKCKSRRRRTWKEKKDYLLQNL